MNSASPTPPTNPNLLPDLYAGAIELALPVFISVGAVSAALLLIMRFAAVKKVGPFAAFVTAFAFLGAVPGMIAGASQEPIIGAFLTALLALVSALLSYLFSKETLAEWRPIIPYAIISMVVCTLFGLAIGGVHKAQVQYYERNYAEYQEEMNQLYYPVEREAQLMELRNGSAPTQ